MGHSYLSMKKIRLIWVWLSDYTQGMWSTYSSILHSQTYYIIPVKFPWIFDILKINRAPGNIQCNLTGMLY